MKTDSTYCNCGKWVVDKGEWKWYCYITDMFIIPQTNGLVKTEPRNPVIEAYHKWITNNKDK